MDILYFLFPLSFMLIWCGFKLLDIALVDLAISLSRPLSWEFWDMVIQLLYGVFYLLTGSAILFFSLNVLPLQ
jgi:hypothetical protein